MVPCPPYYVSIFKPANMFACWLAWELIPYRPTTIGDMMDPNTALQIAREAYAKYVKAAAEMDSETYDIALCDLAEAFDSLDQWLTKGGFLPDSWKVTR